MPKLGHSSDHQGHLGSLEAVELLVLAFRHTVMVPTKVPKTEFVLYAELPHYVLISVPASRTDHWTREALLLDAIATFSIAPFSWGQAAPHANSVCTFFGCGCPFHCKFSAQAGTGLVCYSLLYTGHCSDHGIWIYLAWWLQCIVYIYKRQLPIPAMIQID